SVSINDWRSAAGGPKPKWQRPGNYSSALTLCCGMRSIMRNSAVEPSQLGLPATVKGPLSARGTDWAAGLSWRLAGAAARLAELAKGSLGGQLRRERSKPHGR